MAPLTRSALKLGVVVGTVPAACITLGYRMRAVQASENTNQQGPRVYRACDLPIYQVSNKEDDTGLDVAYPRNAVEEQIGNVRQTIQSFFTQYKAAYDVAKEKVDIGVEHSKSTLDFVQNNPGELPRVAFITVGSLGGFILGYRGSVIRRLLYGTVAGLSCAALCYPQYTVDVSSQFGDGLRDRWDEFRLEELKNGNWPFVKDESTDDENRKKLGLPQNVTKPLKGVPVETSQAAPVKLAGDQGQANPEDKDMYSTRSS